ncbi:Transcription factor bHLH10 [Acorus gramineus]|uniref:Transcription factor bHLH10 n=1 Tax=Acorus gramineus TaxID=55184 RepID=A0AAV9ABT3_ACOGR|nr:Transcription factor bHLH10 [Acorus gramineus]
MMYEESNYYETIGGDIDVHTITDYSTLPVMDNNNNIINNTSEEDDNPQTLLPTCFSTMEGGGGGFDVEQEFNNPFIHQSQPDWAAADFGFAPPPPDLLNLLQLPPPPPILHDPSLQMGFPPPPQPQQPNHLLRELFHSLPQDYGLMRSSGGYYDVLEGQFESSVLEFGRESSAAEAAVVAGEMVMMVGRGGGGGDGRGSFATERQRREQLNEKYRALKSLVPNPTKTDRASTVLDAIEYIKELLRTVDELKILVEKKRREKERFKKNRPDEAPHDFPTMPDMESSSVRPLGSPGDQGHAFNGSLRSSWLQRRSKDTTVDVRIVDDEVNVKLTQRKKTNCLYYLVKAFEELQLELLHVTGGNIGDYYVFMFNTKICEGSPVYASAVAKKMIEVMDRQNPSFFV